MINLVIFPVNDKEGATYYDILYPFNNYLCRPVLRMWCSSVTWAVVDAQEELSKYMDELFGKDNWRINYRSNGAQARTACDFFAKDNDVITHADYWNKRRQYHLPPWDNNTDIYQYPEF